MSARKLGLLATLYVSQGLPFGFFTQAMPVLLRKQGVGLAVVGMSSLLALPWALKFLWAPLVDRWWWRGVGRRRSWIVPAQVLTALGLVGMSRLDPAAGLGPVMAAVVVVNLLCATQDIATDGLAIELLDERERGLANGVQVAGYRAGMVLGGGALLIVFERLGWAGSLLALGALVAVLSGPIAAHRERTAEAAEAREGYREAAAESSGGSGWWRGFWAQPGVGARLVLVGGYKLGEAFGVGMVRPWMVDRGMGLSEVGWVLGTLGFVAGLLGALVGGALVPVLGRRRALEVFAGAQAVALGGYALVEVRGLGGGALAAACVAEHAASGMATAALFTWMMDHVRPATAASDYTLQASVVVVATGVGAALSGVSAAGLGYGGHFALACGLAALVPLGVRRGMGRASVAARGR